MQGKNDSYLDNFLQRLTFSISKHIDNIKKLGLENEVQIVLTDWGSEIKLKDVLNVDFDFIKYIYVKPEIAKKYNGDAKYSYVHPLNVSARNSDGEFILLGDSDSFLPLKSFKKIYELVLEMKKNNIYKFYWGSRYQVPKSDYIELKSIEEIDDFLIRTNKSIFDHGIIVENNFMGNSSIFLIRKEMWDITTGLWEKLIHWGWQDIEFHRRLLKKYEFGGDLEKLGIEVYHLSHPYGENAPVHLKFNDFLVSERINANDENWGLAHEKLEIIYR